MKNTEDIIEINIEAEEGKPGKTPVKEVDYFTKEEQQAFVEDVMSRIRIPEDGKDADPVDYSRIESFVKEEVSKIPKPEDGKDAVVDYDSIVATVLAAIPDPKQTDIDYEALKAFCFEEIKKIEDSRETRVRQLNSGGPTTRLGELVDVDVENAATGQVLSWNGTRWVPANASDIAAVWGGITGTLSNQTDLQTALNAKYDASNPSNYIDASGAPIQSITNTDGYLTISPTTGAVVANVVLSKLTDYYESRNSTITRNGSNQITSLAVTGGRTLTPTRNASGFITSVTDGTRTWTFTRTNNFITSIAIT